MNEYYANLKIITLQINFKSGKLNEKRYNIKAVNKVLIGFKKISLHKGALKYYVTPISGQIQLQISLPSLRTPR
eukprot:Pgem_evm1s11709